MNEKYYNLQERIKEAMIERYGLKQGIGELNRFNNWYGNKHRLERGEALMNGTFPEYDKKRILVQQQYVKRLYGIHVK